MIANISPSYMCYEDTLNTLKYADRAKQIKTVVKRNTLNVEYHISNYKNIINNLRSEITNLKGQLSEAKLGGSIKLKNDDDDSFLPEIQSAGTPKIDREESTEDFKKKQLGMTMHFEREATHKKKILEIDHENEKLAFELFGKERRIRKLNQVNDAGEIKSLVNEIKDLRGQIEQNTQHMRKVQKKLENLENNRNQMLTDLPISKLMFKQNLLNLKDIDFDKLGAMQNPDWKNQNDSGNHLFHY